MRNLLLVFMAFAFLASCGEVTDAAKSAADKTAEAANNVAEGTKKMAGDAVDATKEAASNVAEGAKEVAGDAVDATKDAAGKVVDGAKELAKDAKDAVIGKDGKEYTSAYVCPMHCKGSGSDKPGKCPVCGMDYKKNEHHGHSH